MVFREPLWPLLGRLLAWGHLALLLLAAFAVAGPEAAAADIHLEAPSSVWAEMHLTDACQLAGHACPAAAKAGAVVDLAAAHRRNAWTRPGADLPPDEFLTLSDTPPPRS